MLFTGDLLFDVLVVVVVVVVAESKRRLLIGRLVGLALLLLLLLLMSLVDRFIDCRPLWTAAAAGPPLEAAELLAERIKR